MSGFDFGGGKPKREPNADIRNVAKALHEFYTANRDEGFSVSQSMQLTLTFLEVTLSSGIDNNDAS